MIDPQDKEARWQTILVCLRQIMRATDLHSKQVKKACDLTLPQVLLLRSILEQGDVTVKRLAWEISLSQATVTTILDRLEERGLVERVRSLTDRRIVNARLTVLGHEKLTTAPPLLDEGFMQRFGNLPESEQIRLTQALRQMAGLLARE
ncbi:MarR family transcriptional regulator [Marinobacterium sp. AK62]|uniref:MarR family transcriptional regulator n=1 Tax=Marinobacterium alkalitolerans TaxID=1542925 RepID=A0ABS3Z6F1_9GAMM|nr:MarR family transcriptional regulator [Marinobacterium alkalitolerans]MBP0047285.1 MarR family transcriptional regulator [Marinobacterium alkalitolerans]